MTKLEPLISISRYYGTNPDYVIAGGGNTSVKDGDILYIKASGISLSTIDRDGFVALSRELLRRIEEKHYPEDPVLREEAVKQDLHRAIIDPSHLRPSVETSLHNLIDYAYVVHTHPTMINAVMCANDAEKEVAELFGTEVLYMGYTDPGYTLFKAFQSRVREYKKAHQASPRIIFLQNHGIFVGAGSVDEIKQIYSSVESAIRARKNLTIPASKPVTYQSPAASFIAGYYASRDLVSQAFRSPLSDHFLADSDSFRKISRPFTPDIIVYCKSRYLFLEKGTTNKAIERKLLEFKESNGYYPKVILEEQGGMILVEENDKSLQTVLEVFTDMMKISYLSEQFGGPHSMTDGQISFIDNWEVENYRRSIARS